MQDAQPPVQAQCVAGLAEGRPAAVDADDPASTADVDSSSVRASAETLQLHVRPTEPRHLHARAPMLSCRASLTTPDALHSPRSCVAPAPPQCVQTMVPACIRIC